MRFFLSFLLVAGFSASVALFFYLARLYFNQNALIFRPRGARGWTPADCQLAFETLSLPARSESHAWWIPHPTAEATVLFFHGSESNLTHELPTINFLHRLPANVLAVEYPGYGGNEGRPGEAGCYEAAEAAWRFATAAEGDGGLGLPPERIFLLGQSLGGAVAAFLAADHACGGLVIQSGFTSVPDMAAATFPHLPARWFVHTQMNTLEYVARCRCPVLVLHSRDDEHIPVAHAHRLFAAAGTAGARLGRGGPKKMIIFDGSHTGNRWLQVEAIAAAWRELLQGAFTSWHDASRRDVAQAGGR